MLCLSVCLCLCLSLSQLIAEIKRLKTSTNKEGQPQVSFGYLFEETTDIFEALSGTLSTARKLKVNTIKYSIS